MDTKDFLKTVQHSYLLGKCNLKLSVNSDPSDKYYNREKGEHRCWRGHKERGMLSP